MVVSSYKTNIDLNVGEPTCKMDTHSKETVIIQEVEKT